MAYFPNGSAGEHYEAMYCNHCVHQEAPCPIWDAHLLFAYELCNKKEDPGKVILDMLIPDEAPGAGKCKMYIDNRTASEIAFARRCQTCGHAVVQFGCKECIASVKQ